ncbi:hypothetical protein WJX74_002811 [Apatococcus lobatus]|uniref:Uncharacterized protein n=1 Tax=Apatococcus lobatus TaxID=904363 RepID=A0AAW1Q7H1_9CHLO
MGPRFGRGRGRTAGRSPNAPDRSTSSSTGRGSAVGGRFKQSPSGAGRGRSPPDQQRHSDRSEVEIHGKGAGAVSVELEGTPAGPALWRVVPAFGNHFSPAFLKGLTAWLDCIGPAKTISSQQATSTAPCLQNAAEGSGTAFAAPAAIQHEAARAAASPAVTGSIPAGSLSQQKGLSESAASTSREAPGTASPSRRWWPHAADSASSTDQHASGSEAAPRPHLSAESAGSGALQAPMQSDASATAAEVATQLRSEGPSNISLSLHAESGPDLNAAQVARPQEAPGNNEVAGSSPARFSERSPAEDPRFESANGRPPAATDFDTFETAKPSLPLANALPGPFTSATPPSDGSSTGSVSTGLESCAMDPTQHAHPAEIPHAALSSKATAEGSPESADVQSTASAAQHSPLADSQPTPPSPGSEPEASTSGVLPGLADDDWLDAIRQFNQSPSAGLPNPAAAAAVAGTVPQQQAIHSLEDMHAGPSEHFQFSFNIQANDALETPKASVGAPASMAGLPDVQAANSVKSTDTSTGKRRASGDSHASPSISQAPMSHASGLQQSKPVQLSVHLEHLRLTDGDVGQLADWAQAQASRAKIVKLWLFDNSISDAGAFHVGRMLHEGIQEVHLSHNRITNVGAEALLKCIPTPPLTDAGPGKYMNSKQASQLRPTRQQAQPNAGKFLSAEPAISLGTAGSNSLSPGPDTLQTPSKSPGTGLAPLTSPAVGSPEGPSPTVSAAEQFASLLNTTPVSHRKSSGSMPSDGTSTDPQPTPVGQLERPALSTAASSSDAAALEDTASSPDPTKQASQARQPPLSPSYGEAAGQLQVAAGGKMARKPLWLRLEWNQIGLTEFMQAAEQEKAQRGLVLDMPADEPNRNSATASLHERNLRFSKKAAHARLPWLRLQRLAPKSAPILQEARSAYQFPAASQTSTLRPPPPPPPRPSTASAAFPKPPAVPSDAPVDSTPGRSQGPLLLFPDTSALLVLIGAVPAHSGRLGLQSLQELAKAGLFGRALPAHEQVFVILADSVIRQLDGLKDDPALSRAIRRFLGKGLDAYGPAGADFMTVLGAHEGEGMVLDMEAEVAGSRSPHLASRGQRVDALIVEVALFFQRELSSAARAAADPLQSQGPPAERALSLALPGSSSNGVSNSLSNQSGGLLSTEGAANTDAGTSLLPVLLLSNDNGQLQLARSHGLPAVRLADTHSLDALPPGQPLSASNLRSVLLSAATKGLGSVAGWSLQQEFDGAIACMRLLHTHTASAAAALDSISCICLDPALQGHPDSQIDQVAGALLQHAANQQQLAETLQGITASSKESEASFRDQMSSTDSQQLSNLGQFLPILNKRMQDMEKLVHSHQAPSRVLRWLSMPQ